MNTDRQHELASYAQRRGIQLDAIRSVFPLLSRERALVAKIVGLLATTVPEPRGGYEDWGVPRIAATIALTEKWLPAGLKVVDIGSGSHFSFLLQAQRPDISWLPTDVDTSPVSFTDSRTGDEVYRYSPASLFLRAGRFTIEPAVGADAVSMFEVVEHLPWNPGPLFGSIGDAMKIGGFLMLSTPNICSRSALIRLAGGGSPHQTPILEEGLWYHRKEYSLWELRQLLNWAGFDVVRYQTKNVYLNDDHGWRAWVRQASWCVGALLAASPVEARNLMSHSGSTTFILARKSRPCDFDRPLPKV